jgi:hypothetical protein
MTCVSGVLSGPLVVMDRMTMCLYSRLSLNVSLPNEDLRRNDKKMNSRFQDDDIMMMCLSNSHSDAVIIGLQC